MKISYNWLKDYLECDLAPEAVAEALTSIGLEVDSLEQVEEIPGGLAGVIVAEVVECVEHPDSDHLHITKLNTGDPELLQVVCGAPNVAAGQKVLLATVGTVLGEDFKIKKSKIRGVESFGMICAEDELGIGESHDGIMVLDPEAVVGTPAKEYLGLKTEAVIEIGLTANRVDAASHIGVARDLYAYLKHNGLPCKLNIPDVSAFAEGDIFYYDVKNDAELQKIIANGNSDVLVGLEKQIKYAGDGTIESVTVTGYPAKYVNFRSPGDDYLREMSASGAPAKKGGVTPAQGGTESGGMLGKLLGK